ncbi:hypothetical protein TNCV_2464581 [Trichonephila clavipes]|nr:hypothetical protein TNCV_2464581 [Trichonephila clavipes]
MVSDDRVNLCRYNKNISFLSEDGVQSQGKAMRQLPKWERYLKTGRSFVDTLKMSAFSTKTVFKEQFDIWSRNDVAAGISLALQWILINGSEGFSEGQTINQHYYLHVLAELCERIRKKLPELWKDKSWVLHKDNAPLILHYLARSFLTSTAFWC